MNYFEQTYFVPGKTYDNFIFFGCNANFLNIAEQNLDTKLGRIPSVCVKFSENDSKLLEPFLKEYDEEMQKMIISRTYVNTKIFHQFFKTIENFDISISPIFLKLKNQVQKGMELFNNRNITDFVDYYKNTPLGPYLCKHIIKEHHSYELNVFLDRMDNPYIQKV